MAQFVSATASTLDYTGSRRVVGEWKYVGVALEVSDDGVIGWCRGVIWMRFDRETAGYERAVVAIVVEDDMAGVRDRRWCTDGRGG